MIANLLLALSASTLTPVCDAEMVAAVAPTLSQEAYLYTVNLVESTGGIDKKYADQLRALIEEAYKVQNLEEWAKAHCGLGNETNPGQ